MWLKYVKKGSKIISPAKFNEVSFERFRGGIVQSHFEAVVKATPMKLEIDAKKPLETEKIVGLRNGYSSREFFSSLSFIYFSRTLMISSFFNMIILIYKNYIIS